MLGRQPNSGQPSGEACVRRTLLSVAVAVALLLIWRVKLMLLLILILKFLVLIVKLMLPLWANYLTTFTPFQNAR